MERLERTWAELENMDAINEYLQWESLNVPCTGDKSLASFLKKHDFIPAVLNALLVRVVASEDGPFDSLIQAANKGQQALFTQKTAKDFHRLVLGTFIMLTTELEEFITYYHQWKCLDTDARNAAMQSFRRIGLYTRLLLNILASTSFRNYMVFMAQHGIKYLVPVFEERLSYQVTWKLRRNMSGSSQLSGEPPLDMEVDDFSQVLSSLTS